MRRFQSLLFVACLVAGAFAQTKEIAITGARIELGDGRSIASGTILVRDGKIVAVGENVSVPSGAETIDGTGKVVYPGFIDGYSTRGVKLPDAPAAGTPPDSRNTAPPSMWHGNRKGIRSDVLASKSLDLKTYLSDNHGQGITSALVAPGSGTIRGVATVLSYTETGEILVPSAAVEFSVRGGGFGGGGGGGGGESGYPGSLLGIVALTRQTLIDAQQYADNPPEKADPSLENLKPLVRKEIPGIFFADNEREIGRAIRIGDEFGFRVVVAGARDAYKLTDLLKAKNVPVLASLDLGNEPTRTPGQGPDATPQAVLDERYENWRERSENALKLHEAGVPFAFTTVGTNLTDFLKNVRRVIGTGLPKEAALKAMTSGAAKILGVESRLGTIEAGKDANLVLMSGDFADDKSEVVTVFVSGTKVDMKKGDK